MVARISITILFILCSIFTSVANQQPHSHRGTLNSAESTALSSGQEVWEYWQHDDVKLLDPWGDSGSNAMDMIAIYEKEESEALAFRVDFMDLATEVITPTYIALDYVIGGTDFVEPGNDDLLFELNWDLMVAVSGTQFILFDSTFTAHPDLISATLIDRTLDFISFTIDRSALIGWDGSPFQMQALAANADLTAILDQTTTTPTNSTTGRGKLVIFSLGGTIGFNPDAVSWYDGYRLRPNERLGERRGFRYTLDAVEKYKLPLTYSSFGTDVSPSNEFLHINDRMRNLSAQGLLDPIMGLFYGHFHNWQPDDVDQKAIELVVDLNENLDLPVSEMFYPYEAMITSNDIQVIQDAGFQAIYGHDQYRYWFGWIDDWSDPAAVKAQIESLRKVHLINGMKFIFHTSTGNYQGIYMDERWEPVNWDEWSEYDSYIGTDQGLYLWWRRTLQDMAMNPDQEQFFTIGTDYTLTSWMFPDYVDWNFKWLASHPWIEVTTFSDIIGSNWSMIDHGDLGLPPDELLVQHQLDGDQHYNAYFPQFYYGGVSDGHSPLIPTDEEIEAYYDYVPFLRDGIPIPSGRIMGDDQTPGSIVYETLANLRSAPDNDLTRLAWIAYFHSIGEQTFHSTQFFTGGEEDPGAPWGGRYLHPNARFTANKMRQVNKIIAASYWVEDVKQGTVPSSSQAISLDLDLDGEGEYILSNNRVFAIFENDGARLEYAFAFSPANGPLQLVAPIYQVTIKKLAWGTNYENGEIGELLHETWQVDSAFVDDWVFDNEIELPVYNADITDSTLSFLLPDGTIQKSFYLLGDSIQSHYTVNNLDGLHTAFGFVNNLQLMYMPEWGNYWQAIPSAIAPGWQTTLGGSAQVFFWEPGSGLSDSLSFSQSPAPEDQQERDDYNTYPPGHYFPYPYSSLFLHHDSSDGEIRLNLRLGADPLRFIYLPLIQK